MIRVLVGAFALWAALSTPALAGMRVVVDLTVDIGGGVATGSALYPDGRRASLRIQRPRLEDVRDPFEGYIGPDDALLPVDAGWLPPLPDDADGWTVRVATPPGFMAAPYPNGSVAVALGGGSVSEFQIDVVAARGPLIVGRFQLGERQAGDVTIRTFFTERNAGQSEAYLDAAEAAIEALVERIGPYPFEAFAVVESPLPVGLGFPGYTLVSSRIVPLPFMRGRSLWHEIAHVWWGNGVLVDYDRGNWAEGFATFFADYGLAEARGADAAREMRYDWLLEFDAVAPADDVPLRRFVAKSHGQSQAIGYGKAAMVLHMLRRRIGDDAFDDGVHKFWTDNIFQEADWADIEAAFADASGQDLRDFFDRWVDRPGAAPPDPADVDFDMFRELTPEERIATLRAAFAPGRFTVQAMAGAPGDAPTIASALAPLGPSGADGTPVYVGDVATLSAVFDRAPPDVGDAAIWAGTDGEGALALGLVASDLETVAMLAGRSRHYGRWSWLTVGADGRPNRGRWPRD